MVGISIRTSDAILTRRSGRAAAAAISSSVGAAYMLLVEPMLGTAGAIFVLSLGLVAPLGVAKSATACGLNVVADLASVGRPAVARLSGATVYALTATLIAATLGYFLSAVGALTGASSVLKTAGVAFVVLGLMELGVTGRGRALTLPWQVPAAWVSRRRFAPVVWGLLLGSGLTTYMPHPAYFGVLLMALVLPFPMGVVLMAIYGLSRAIPVVATAAQRSDSLLLRLHRDVWRLRAFGHAIAGCVSLAVAAALFVSVLRHDMISFTLSMPRAIALGLAMILFVSALGKVRDPGGFASLLRTTYGVPETITRPTAVAVLVAEVVVAALLVWDPGRHVGLGLAALLLGSFMAASGYAWGSGGSGACGCYGPFGSSHLGVGTIFRSAAFALVAAVAFGAESSFAVEPQIPSTPGLAVLVLPTLALTLAAVRTAWRLRLAIGRD